MDDDNQSTNSTWWPWRRTKEQNLAKQFNGHRGWDGHFFYRPTRSADAEQGHVNHDRPDDYGAAVAVDQDGKHIFLNRLGQTYVKYSDVAVYLSPTNYRPKRLVVQSTDYVLRNRASVGGDWRRKELNGDVPSALRLSEWGLEPFQRGDAWSRVTGSLRMLAIAIPLQFLLAIPGTSSWDDGDVSGNYTDFPNYQWQWPKHTINPLDQRPGSVTNTVVRERPSSRKRILRPRKLYVQQPDGNWEVVDNPPKNLQYVFISYAAKSFRLDGSDGHALTASIPLTVPRRTSTSTACAT
ncbi:hypothetical protein O1611_g7144 [Lasiodiplodia mahajangana]|uniref:Uncharacterized protein n=1 Tax=Lasiodiplodia mahajangana TaxID=1108764 RepID=A0ACC2JGP8_9PEZI|nr:hypothetical protein O1611_g7144 [Lasiodiplodia mahajangana]